MLIDLKPSAQVLVDVHHPSVGVGGSLDAVVQVCGVAQIEAGQDVVQHRAAPGVVPAALVWADRRRGDRCRDCVLEPQILRELIPVGAVQLVGGLRETADLFRRDLQIAPLSKLSRELRHHAHQFESTRVAVSVHQQSHCLGVGLLVVSPHDVLAIIAAKLRQSRFFGERRTRRVKMPHPHSSLTQVPGQCRQFRDLIDSPRPGGRHHQQMRYSTQHCVEGLQQRLVSEVNILHEQHNREPCPADLVELLHQILDEATCGRSQLRRRGH